MRTDPEGGYERHVAVGKLAYGRVVEAVVVIVRHEHEVYRRHRAKGNRHGLEALGARERRWRRARSRDRISQHATTMMWIDRRMSEPCGACPLAGVVPQVLSGFIDGSVPRGTRRYPRKETL